MSDDAGLRDDIRGFEENNAILITKQTKTFEENGVYKIYGNYSKKIADMPSYAYLAVCRAEDEKQLSLSMQFSYARIIEQAKAIFIPKNANSVVSYLIEAIEDGLVLLLPSIEREIRRTKNVELMKQLSKYLVITSSIYSLHLL